MKESRIDGFEFINNLTYENPDHMSAQALAYIGDAVYELYIRGLLVSKGIRNSKQLHRAKVEYAKASGQRNAYEKIVDMLDEAEQRIVSRGRNFKSGSVPKNADPSDYAYATAFEALIGYIYLKNDKKRLMDILDTAVGEIK